jgi:glycosyltransferase involved in cell wall biosynthesis
LKQKKIIYVYPHKSSFIQRDIDLLSTQFCVTEYLFDVSNKKRIPWILLKQFIFLILNLPKTKAVYCHFAGYPALLPSLLSKIYRKPCFVIVAGTDAACFPDFKYGNFVRKLQGKITGISLRYATHILPVHESLHFQNYDYYEGGMPAQGYAHFYPKAKNVPFTPVYYAYDNTIFKSLGEKRRKNSYLTVGNLSQGYMFKRKGYDLIIELAKRKPDLHFTLVGWDGKQVIEVPENVSLLPFMNQQELIQCFNQHEFYFQLSIMEGFPNALAEALLCGCIGIGSNVSGIPHIIGDTGFILRKHNINELIKLIDETQKFNESELYFHSNAARKRICDNFTLQIRLEELIKIYNIYVKDEINHL